MELITIILIIFAWITYKRSNEARNDIKALRDRITYLERLTFSNVDTAGRHEQIHLSTQEDILPPSTTGFPSQESTLAKLVRIPSIIPRTSSDRQSIESKNRYTIPWVSKLQGSFEQNLATKLPVWIGSICLILSAFFLVKYSIDAGWLSPIVRTILGGAFGISLIYVGRWIFNRSHISNNIRISQGLLGAGLVSLYVSIYAAINLYNFIPSSVGFILMIAVTITAVILSLRYGQPIAIFGLIGGVLTPSLIGSEDSNLVGLLAYVFLLFSGFFYILVKQGWWRLALCAVIAAFFWPTLWFSFAFKEDLSFAVTLFSVSIVAVVLSMTGKLAQKDEPYTRQQIQVLNFFTIALAAIGLFWLSSKVTLSLFDWSMMGALSVAVMGLTFFQPDIYARALWSKVAATLILFFMWSLKATLPHALIVTGGLVALYVALPTFLMQFTRDKRIWAGLQTLAAILLYLICYIRIDSAQNFTEAFPAFWGLLSLTLATAATYNVYKARNTSFRNLVEQDHMIAIYALAASSFISIGFAIEIPSSYLVLALSAQVAATAWIFNRIQIDYLKTIMLLLSILIVILNYEQVLLFMNLLFFSFLDQASLATITAGYVIDMPLIKLGLPSFFFATAFWFLYKKESLDRHVLPILFVLSGLFTLATIYYEVRDLFQVPSAQHIFALPSGFIERSLITTVIAALAMASIRAFQSMRLEYIRLFAISIFGLAMFRYLYFDILFENPYWSKDQNVGVLPLINGVTLVYGGAILLAGWAVINKNLIKPNSARVEKFYKVFGFVALFLFITLNIRQFFHGEFLHYSFTTSISELYSYSILWLVTGLGLLAFGIKRSNKSARMASLGFMIITIFKVFLVDAAELSGLLRVISFMGLGISLIGLSVFYTKFVFRPRNDPEIQSN